MNPKEKLQAHSDEFRKQLISISDNVHMGVGYGASNATMIEGKTSLIIVDTLESTSAAELLLADFRQISQKPVGAIIYTHSHRDHVSGATVFAAGFADGREPIIYARPAETDMLGAPEIANISRLRAKRQFAIGEPSWVRINLGLGPGERPLKGLGAGVLPATHLVTEARETLSIDGETIECVAAPGETTDTMVLWLPDQRILIGADNYYKSFPNISPIRGSSYRDVGMWVDSLNTMLALEADVLIPGHSRPLQGAETIREVLTNYRDAIQFVLEETLAGIDKGMTPDELVQTVKLPMHLAELPYLQEFYGHVAWSVRAIFAGYLGWFDGNPTNMFPLPPQEEAQRMATLAGGTDALLANLKNAVNEGDSQWALQLADALIALNVQAADAKLLKSQALKSLAEEQVNATARHYYLTYAHELESEVNMETVHEA
ncbi:MAG: alkyl/aryl-sulfatase [Chloroflexota bacterium]